MFLNMTTNMVLMTIGYEGLKPEDFLDKLQENNVSFLNTKANKS